MYDVDVIEAINFEQLVTRTDRLLIRGGRLPKHRPSTNRIGPALEAEQTMFVRRNAVDLRVVLTSAILTVAFFIATLA